MIDTIGADALSLRDWFLLSLFGAAHDLRQREAPDFAAGIGSNERASVEETFRILRACGFTPERNSELFVGCELMISGSTFDARPSEATLEYNPAELVVQSGGALAQKLEVKLDKHASGWRSDERVQHAQRLALIAADLDTANVAEPFALFMASAERLCLEREMRSGAIRFRRRRRADADVSHRGPGALFLRAASIQLGLRPPHLPGCQGRQRRKAHRPDTATARAHGKSIATARWGHCARGIPLAERGVRLIGWLTDPGGKLRKCRRILAPAAPCASRTLRGPAL
jgi:hypothetical protein